MDQERPDELKSAAELAAEGETTLEKNLEDAPEEPGIPAEEIAAMDEQAAAATREDADNLAAHREKMGLPQPEETPETDPAKEALEAERAEFKQELSDGNLESAEAKLMALREKINDREMDHKSRDLSKAAKAAGNWELAIRMIQFARNASDRKARAKALPSDVKKQYADALSQYLGDATETPEAEPASKLEKALGSLQRAQENGDAGDVDLTSLVVFREARKAKNWDLARQMIELANGEDARAGRQAVWEKESGQTY